MEPIKTQDVWIGVEADGIGSNPLEWAELAEGNKITMVEKKSDMVVMTKEEFQQAARDIFAGGADWAVNERNNYYEYATEYINQLIK